MADPEQERNPAFPDALARAERDLLCCRWGRGSDPDHIVGFGLSGGGIRSATFCLGIFQELARLDLLKTIDYLSTVSGGGYFGAFYGRLFTRKELVRGDVERILVTPSAAKQRETIDAHTTLTGRVFRWLRDNGRYLAPNGSGDVLVAGAAVMRNLIAIHLVLATFVMMICLAAQLVRGVIEVNLHVGEWEQAQWWTSLQSVLTNHVPAGEGLIWWSPYVALVPLLFCFLAIPPGWCYWLVESPNRDTAGRWIPPFYGWLLVVLLSLPMPLLAAYVSLCPHLRAAASCPSGGISEGPTLSLVASAVTLVVAMETLVLGLLNGYRPRLAFARSASGPTDLFQNEQVRLRLSVQLKTALALTGGVAGFAVIDSLAQTLYGAALLDEFHPRLWLTAVFAALVPLAGFGRTILSFFSGAGGAKKSRPPLRLLAGAAALLLVTFLLTIVDAGAYLVAWKAHVPPGPRPNWTTAPPLRDATRLDLQRESNAPEWSHCRNETVGRIKDHQAGTLTIATAAGDVTLALDADGPSWLRQPNLDGKTVSALYREEGTGRRARLIYPGPELAAAHTGWRISADSPRRTTADCGSRRSSSELVPAAAAFLITFAFSFLFGWSWPFLNRSTHQPIYTSRLVRAYLGASNPKRLADTGKSVTQSIPEDDINQEEYWPRHEWLRPLPRPSRRGEERRRREGHRPTMTESEAPRVDEILSRIRAGEQRLLGKGMPLHLINVTINETLDARTQVEQRDRKGIGMAIGPVAISAGVHHHIVLADTPDGVVPGPSEARGFEARVYPQGPNDGSATADSPRHLAAPHQIFRYATSATSGRLEYTGEFLTLGGWTGISGAAFSTSLGWRTSLAYSLLAGLANVRLTYWWNSGVKRLDRGRRRGTSTPNTGTGQPADGSAGDQSNTANGTSTPRTSRASRLLSAGLRGLFSVQFFLFDELLARFHGTAPQWWPLSDGGHFENLGGYELIRRRLPVIVIVDAEADPEYTFEGLSNLVRKARLDFGAEIEFLDVDGLDEQLHPDIRRYFGTIEQLRRGTWVEEPVEDPGDPRAGHPARPGAREWWRRLVPSRLSDGERAVRHRRSISPVAAEALSLAHAALARVTYDGDADSTSWLLYIKPTLIGDESTDVHRYHTEHPSFPHETTLQQFFDEAQWESYRKLGEHIARKIFQTIPAAAELGGRLSPHRLLSP